MRRLGLLFLLVLTVAGCGGSAGRVSSPTGVTPRPSPVFATSEDWYAGGGYDVELSLFYALAKALSPPTSGDAAFLAACGELGVEVDAARSFAPIPDPTAQQLWAQGLEQWTQATFACTQQRYADAGTLLEAGNSSLVRATQIIGHSMSSSTTIRPPASTRTRDSANSAAPQPEPATSANSSTSPSISIPGQVDISGRIKLYTEVTTGPNGCTSPDYPGIQAGASVNLQHYGGGAPQRLLSATLGPGVEITDNGVSGCQFEADFGLIPKADTGQLGLVVGSDVFAGPSVQYADSDDPSKFTVIGLGGTPPTYN